jgi:DNA helicase TIP49 (TBP-interacting protein)
LSTIDESEQKEIKKYISLPQSEIQKRYEVLSEMVIEKLEVMSESSEPEVLSKINETIEKIKSEKINVVSLVKLKNLTENL